MNTKSSIVLAALSVTIAGGCDGRSPGLTEDTGACSARPTSFGSLGELTAFPEISTSITGASLGLRSVNFVAVPPVGDFLPYVEVLAEVENTGPSRLCSATFDVRLGGYEETGVLHGAQYILPPPVEIAISCVAPGDRGVIRVLFHEVTEEDLLSTTTLRIAHANDQGDDAGETPYDLTTLSEQRIVEVEGGYQLVQTVTADRDVLNYFQDVYAVDARGLLIADLDVPSYGPTSGGASLTAGEPEALESDVVGCEFVDFILAGEHYFEP